jgi:hypothetical protein
MEKTEQKPKQTRQRKAKAIEVPAPAQDINLSEAKILSETVTSEPIAAAQAPEAAQELKVVQDSATALQTDVDQSNRRKKTLLIVLGIVVVLALIYLFKDRILYYLGKGREAIKKPEAYNPENNLGI